MKMIWSSLVMAGVFFGACAAPALRAQNADDSNYSRNEKNPLSVKVGNQSISDSSPLVVELKPLGSVIGSERDFREKNLRLKIKVLRPNETDWSGFRVFLNLPKNAAKTSVEAPEYIGSAAFYGGAVGKELSFTFSLNKKLERLSQAKKLAIDAPLSVTVVPISARAADASSPGGFFVRQISVEIEALR